MENAGGPLARWSSAGVLSRGGGTCCLLLDLVTLPSSALLDSLKVQSDGTTVCVCVCECVCV